MLGCYHWALTAFYAASISRLFESASCSLEARTRRITCWHVNKHDVYIDLRMPAALQCSASNASNTSRGRLKISHFPLLFRSFSYAISLSSEKKVFSVSSQAQNRLKVLRIIRFHWVFANIVSQFIGANWYQLRNVLNVNDARLKSEKKKVKIF